jgi:hypothetical protein
MHIFLIDEEEEVPRQYPSLQENITHGCYQTSHQGASPGLRGNFKNSIPDFPVPEIRDLEFESSGPEPQARSATSTLSLK